MAQTILSSNNALTTGPGSLALLTSSFYLYSKALRKYFFLSKDICQDHNNLQVLLATKFFNRCFQLHYFDTTSQYLKINRTPHYFDILVQFRHFTPIFVQLKLTRLVTLFDCKLQFFKNLQRPFLARLMNFCPFKM